MKLRGWSVPPGRVRAVLTLLAVVAFALSLFLAGRLQTVRRPFSCPPHEACDVYFDDTHDRRTWQRLGMIVAGGTIAVALRWMANRVARER
jgi:hypothetical protein